MVYVIYHLNLYIKRLSTLSLLVQVQQYAVFSADKSYIKNNV